MILNNTYSFLGSTTTTALQAAGADVNVSAHNLSITTCPSMDYRKIVSSTGLQSFLLETAKSVTVTPVAANNSTYSLSITQFVAATNNYVTVTLNYTTLPAGDTATIICNAFRAQLAAYGSQIQVTGSGTATLILIGNTGNPLFTVQLISLGGGLTQASNMLLIPTIASNTTADPTVITMSAPHGLFVGQVVTLVSADQTKLVDGTYRVASTPLVTTLTLSSVDGNTTLAGTATTTGTLTLVAQYAKGTFAALTALGIVGQASGRNYSTLGLTFERESSGSTVNIERDRNIHTLYLDSGDANLGAFATRLALLLKNIDPNGVDIRDALPQSVAIIAE
jgi:hypothetical protein